MYVWQQHQVEGLRALFGILFGVYTCNRGGVTMHQANSQGYSQAAASLTLWPCWNIHIKMVLCSSERECNALPSQRLPEMDAEWQLPLRPPLVCFVKRRELCLYGLAAVKQLQMPDCVCIV